MSDDGFRPQTLPDTEELVLNGRQYEIIEWDFRGSGLDSDTDEYVLYVKQTGEKT